MVDWLHRSKLVDRKRLTVSAHAPLRIKEGAPVQRWIENKQSEHEEHQNGQQQGANSQVDDTLSGKKHWFSRRGRKSRIGRKTGRIPSIRHVSPGTKHGNLFNLKSPFFNF
jgi:hypothetical protein